MGVPSTPAAGQVDMRNPATGLADFKYMCAGYSMYTKPEKDGAGKRKGLGNDIVNLPYCEGLEVISSRDMQDNPVLLKEGMADGAIGDAKPVGPSSSTEKSSPVPGMGKNFVPGANVDLEDFPSRFMRVAKKIVNKMYANLKSAVASLRKVLGSAVDLGPKKD